MRWLLPIVALLATGKAQLNASDVTYIADGPESNTNTSSAQPFSPFPRPYANKDTSTSPAGVNGFGDYYVIPGSAPTVTLIDNIARRGSQALDTLKTYQAIFTASMQVCGEFPTDNVRRSFQLEVGDLLVSFVRVGDRRLNPVQYEDLCFALRGIGELITRDSLSYNVYVRVITARANYVRADVAIEQKPPSTGRPAVDVAR